MTLNVYRGEVAIELGGEQRVLRYPWAAVSELRDVVGGDVLEPMRQAMVNLDLATTCKALVIGLREGWPEVTAERLMALSPPIIPTMTAVELALYRAFHGNEAFKGAAADPRPNPLQRALEIAKAILSWRPWKTPSFAD